MTTTTDESLVRYVAGRLKWITRQGVEDVFKAARDFSAQERHYQKTDADREKAVKQQMGFS